MMFSNLRRSISQVHYRWKLRSFGSDPNYPPILIYTMGKVGSTSAYRTIKQQGLKNQVFHVHFLSDDLEHYERYLFSNNLFFPHIFVGKEIQRKLAAELKSTLKVISLVRDPIAFAISDFFQNRENSPDELWYRPWNYQEILCYLQQKIQEDETLTYVFDWFDREIKRVLGIDVMTEGFDKDLGFKVYSSSKAELLVFQIERFSQIGPLQLRKFLDADRDPEIVNANIRKDSEFSALYRFIQENITFDREFLENVYAREFVQNFYSNSQIENFLAKWM